MVITSRNRVRSQAGGFGTSTLMRMGYPATITGSVLGRGSRGMPASGKKNKKSHGIVKVPHSITYAGYTNGNAQSHGIFMIKILRDLIIGYSKVSQKRLLLNAMGRGCYP